MSNALNPIKDDAGLVVDDAVIRLALGEAYPRWQELTETLGSEFGLAASWQFYRDGGWLAKVLKGKKNLAWLTIWEGFPRMTFYFPARHREPLTILDIPSELSQRIADAPMSGATLPVSLELRTSEDVATALTILRYKIKAK